MRNVDTSTWKEFKLSELFDISTTKAIDRKNVIFTSGGLYDFIGRTSVGYGVQGRVDRLAYAPNPANTFSLVQVGETCCLFREREWYASQNIFMLTPKDKHLCDAQLFLTAVINKKLEPYKAAYTYPTLKVLQDLTILLPVTEIEEIDFEYMEARIRELEEARIRELEEALRVMGLHDTKLTEEEEKALIKNMPTHNFLIKDICDVTYGNKFDKNKMSHTNPNVNFVSRTANNNGISDKVDLIQGIEPYGSGLVTLALGGSVGSCFIQDSPFYTGQNVGVLNFPSHCTREAKLYIVCALSKKCKATYTAFADEINKHLKTDLSIDLPVKNLTGTIDSIDYNHMHNYIRAIEKLTIQKLYDDKGIFIDKAKEVCSIEGE